MKKSFVTSSRFALSAVLAVTCLSSASALAQENVCDKSQESWIADHKANGSDYKKDAMAAWMARGMSNNLIFPSRGNDGNEVAPIFSAQDLKDIKDYSKLNLADTLQSQRAFKIRTNIINKLRAYRDTKSWNSCGGPQNEIDAAVETDGIIKNPRLCTDGRLPDAGAEMMWQWEGDSLAVTTCWSGGKAKYYCTSRTILSHDDSKPVTLGVATNADLVLLGKDAGDYKALPIDTKEFYELAIGEYDDAFTSRIKASTACDPAAVSLSYSSGRKSDSALGAGECHLLCNGDNCDTICKPDAGSAK